MAHTCLVLSHPFYFGKFLSLFEKAMGVCLCFSLAARYNDQLSNKMDRYIHTHPLQRAKRIILFRVDFFGAILVFGTLSSLRELPSWATLF
ncbi:hypothetical protein CPB86DRAFT_791582 [Serendipita vermifera]|nr:hypothetical protein CPB86DRAFT_791582 [Serendipita vermifera]